MNLKDYTHPEGIRFNERFEQREKGRVLILGLAGDIDASTYRDVEIRLQASAHPSVGAIIVDLGGVNYVASIGIRTIFWAKKFMKERNIPFALVNPKPRISDLFNVMKIVPVLDIFPFIDEANRFVDSNLKRASKHTR